MKQFNLRFHLHEINLISDIPFHYLDSKLQGSLQLQPYLQREYTIVQNVIYQLNWCWVT